MKLIGTLAIIYEVLLAITIVGLIIAWLPIWMGVLLNRVANEARDAATTGDEESVITATSSLKTIFQVQNIIVLVMLVLWSIAIVVGIIAAASNA